VDFELLDAKNGEKTIKVDSLFLHSSYNPSKEAERFVETLSVPFVPSKMIIIEPALSYCVPFLHKRFPKTKLGFIKLAEDFPPRNGFDFEVDYLNHSKDFSNYLSSTFSETELFNTFFISWPASSKVFSQKDSLVWQGIKAASENAKTMLITREYFEKKWLINSCVLLKNINCTTKLTSKIEKPVLICASGPSLKPNLTIIKENQKSFFIIALSSALSVLLKNKIQPDLVFSTDGGYWAGEHLKKLKNLTIALPLEAYCPKSILQKNTVLPLIYSDGISSTFKDFTNINFDLCQRNGTVSGTALEYALAHSNQNIYFCGLDLSSQKGFQHTQPNELEFNNFIKDNRIKTKEKRLFPGSLKNESLLIYENWFKNQAFPKNRIFRIIDKKYKKNDLGNIVDISNEAFVEICKKNSSEKSEKYFDAPISRDSDLIKKECKELHKNLKEQLDKEKNLSLIFPLSFVLLSHLQIDSEQYNLQKNKIKKESDKLFQKLDKILNDR